MAAIDFVDQSTVIYAAWLNHVGGHTYDGKNPNFVTSTGSANAQVVTLTSSTMTALEDGQIILFKAGYTNLGATTLAVIGAATTGAIAVQFEGSALAGSEIVSGNLIGVAYLNSVWNIVYNTNWPYALSSSTYGRNSIPVCAVSMKPSVTGGCADIASVAAGAGMPDITYLAFDATTAESAQFSIRMPTNWNENTITFDYQWSHAATTVNFGTVFGLSAVAVSNDDTIGVSFGTEVLITDTGGTTNDGYISPESGAVTVAGSPQAGDIVYFKVTCQPGEASHTIAIDSRLSGLTLYITTDAAIG